MHANNHIMSPFLDPYIKGINYPKAASDGHLFANPLPASLYTELDLYYASRRRHSMDRNSIEYLWVIDSGFAYGGIIIRSGQVVETAPIFRKLMGHNTKTLKWLLGKWGWKLIRIVRRRL